MEVMVSIAVFSLTILASALAFSSAMASQRRAAFTTFASDVLRDQVERTRATAGTTVAAYPTSTTLAIPSPLSTNPMAKQCTLTRTVVSLTDFTGMKEITFTIQHGSGKTVLSRSTTFRYYPDGIAAYILGTTQ